METRRSFLGKTLFVMGTSVGAIRHAGAQSDPSVVGQWSGVSAWPVVAIHTHLLPNGKVLLWPRDGGAGARVWDPATGGFTPVPLTTFNIFCAGHAFLPDGRLMVTGGHVRDGYGEKTAHIFDPATNGWTRIADMNDRRWYPTSTALANGESLVVSGSIHRYATINKLPQVWTGSAWRSLTGAQLSLPLYPMMHLAPDGRVFNSGPNTTTRYLNTSGTGAWTSVANRTQNRDYGSSVLYDTGKVVLMGGGDPPVASTEVIDLTQSTPAWRAVAPMAFARRQMNATLLPDGKVLATGGTSGSGFNNAIGSVLAAEMWDPATEGWTTLAGAAERRLYHSTALLLPDGRVLSAGGGQPAGTNGDADHLTMEIYSPPYLFRGTRPTISSAPASVAYGQSFAVGTPDGASVTAVTLVKLGSVTHAFNSDQRILRPAFSAAAGGLTVTAPSSPNLCPPGHYLLFLLNGSGVPSVARTVRIG